MAVTTLGAALPGAGLVWSGRRWGYLLLLAAVAGAVALAGYFNDLRALLDFAVDPMRLRAAAVIVAVALLLWALTVVLTYAKTRPVRMPAWQQVLGAGFVVLLCGALAAPVAVAVRYADVQADLVTEVFEENRTATVPDDVTVEDPWGGRRRVNVLLLGGDGDVGRDGVRTDSVILLSLDTRTGDAVQFSLPRNLVGARFPVGSPLHERYPNGFVGYGDPAEWMLNAIYEYVPALHPGVLGDSDNEGADAVKQAVAGSLGLRVDYYVLVNLAGFRQIVDAIGGVTVNINEPVAIQGDTDRGIPPTGYLEPGPNQRLNGFEALWFSRGRWGSDDYERMLRQRCMVDAIIREADPLTLLRRYTALVKAGKEIVRTDIPADLLPAFVDLAIKVKQADVRSVAFVSSSAFSPGNPDFTWLQNAVRRALADAPPPPPPPSKRDRAAGGPRHPTQPAPPDTSPAPSGAGAEAEPDPGEAVQVADSCAYRPES